MNQTQRTRLADLRTRGTYTRDEAFELHDLLNIEERAKTVVNIPIETVFPPTIKAEKKGGLKEAIRKIKSKL